MTTASLVLTTGIPDDSGYDIKKIVYKVVGICIKEENVSENDAMSIFVSLNFTTNAEKCLIACVLEKFEIVSLNS